MFRHASRVILTLSICIAAVFIVSCESGSSGSDGPSDAECVSEDKANLDITLGYGDSASGVTQHITLPVTGASGTTVSWQSSNMSVIANNGTVNRPSYTKGDTAVILTATIAKGSARDTKTFDLTVIKAAATEAECVEEDKVKLEIGYKTGDSEARVTQNITLHQTGASGTTITWVSNNTAIVVNANVGEVTRPAHTGNDVKGALIATITKGGSSVTRSFALSVIKEPDLSLASLVVSKGKLQPAFDPSKPNITKYLDAPVPFSDNTNPAYDDSQSAGITATVADANAVMTINGTVVQSGDEHEMNNLKVGKNMAMITIAVLGDVITPKNYTVEVYRAIPVFKTGPASTDAGISWPSPRFTDNVDGTVTDKMTGLMWIKNANAIKTLYPDFDHQPDTGWRDGMVTWAKALEFIGKINVKDSLYNCGATTTYTDWRMPNVREMRTLLSYSQDFSLITGVFSNAATLRDDYYFTSTTDPNITGYVMTTSFNQSSINPRDPNSTFNYVWPVRSAP